MAIFNNERRAICLIGDAWAIQAAEDTRTCRDWMRDTLRLSDDECETTTRGYLLPGRIQFFVGSDYHTATKLTVRTVRMACQLYKSAYAPDPVDPVIGNGCKVGAEGEQWSPILVLGKNAWEVYQES